MADLLNVLDYERAAAAVMLPDRLAYYAGGVADELTLAENRRAFERLRLRPRVMRGVEDVDAGAAILGERRRTPWLIAPSAMHKLAHPHGELATARAARDRGVPMVLSTLSTTAVEDVAAIGGRVWFQLYVFRDRAWSERIVRRAVGAGCEALVLTVDLPVQGLRENLVRAGFSTPPELPFPNLTEPGETRTVSELMTTVAANFDPGLTWRDLEWLRGLCDLPIVVKGILRGDDALLAAEAGAAAVVVSNHGGRQLDTTIASIDALPEVVEAVGERVEVLFDGGVRRGTDALKALALGARGVLLGRAPLWGLAVGGERGVRHVLEILDHELENAMAQCGASSIADLTSDLLFRPDPLTPNP